jgi:DNA (cytosine-5)-methyltransferase 1
MDVVRKSRSVLYSIKEIMLKLLDLFSGIGGFSLGLESTGGFETIAFVEKDDFCQKVLKKHWPNTTIEGDIRNVKGNKYEADIITGGFPCQPFSVAGKRKGTDDDRYLWDETIRVVRECKPKWFIGENVEGLININNGVVLRQVQTDLEKEGFEVQCLVIPASGIGAWHQRKRIWIVANSSSQRSSSQSIGEHRELDKEIRRKKETGDQSTLRTSSSCSDVPNTKSSGHRGWSSQECKNGEWSFLQGEQKGRKMGSEIEGCDGDVSNSESISSNDGRYGNDSKEKQIQLKVGRESSSTNVSNSESKRTRKNDQGLWESFGGINGRERTNVSNSNNSRDRTSTHGINKDGKKKIERREEFSQLKFSGYSKETWWQTQSRICGVPNGVSFELDKTRSNRIKSLGNSIVPQIVRELGFAILEAEKNT